MTIGQALFLAKQGMRQSPCPQGADGLVRDTVKPVTITVILVLSAIRKSKAEQRFCGRSAGRGVCVLLHRGTREGPSEKVMSEQRPR